MAKTRIVVLQMKEIIYTAIFIGLGILLILLLVFMFLPSSKEENTETGAYESGVYTSEIQLGESTLNLEVVVDKEQIKTIQLVNLDDSVTTMYPLIKPSLESLETQLASGVSPENITLAEKGKYTQTLLLEAIQNALESSDKKE